MKRLSRWLVAVMAVLCLAAPGAAQDHPSQAQNRAGQGQGQATQRISIDDEQGGAIIGAKVTLIDKATGETREKKTDRTGHAVFENLLPGDYVLKASFPGFVALQRNVTVGTNPEPLTLKLKIEVKDEVTVTAEAAPKESRTEAAQNADVVSIGNGMLGSLPLAIDPQQLQTFIGNFLSPLAGAGEQTVIVDGMEVSSISVPTAAVNHVYVNKNPYSPEYRQLGKARVEIVTENGSRRRFNANLGMTSTFADLNARNAFSLQKSDAHKNFPEMGVSGPLGRKLGSFLVSTQYLDNQQTSVVNAVTLAGPLNTTVPTPVHSTTTFARVDLRLTGADHLSIQYNLTSQRQGNLGVGGLILPSQGAERTDTEHRLRFSLDSKLTAAFTDELQVLLQHKRSIEGSPPVGPAIQVEGAFEGGFSPLYLDRDTPAMDVRNALDYVHGNHHVRFGGRFKVSHAVLVNAANFGGTYSFPSLEAYAAGQPSLFDIAEGNSRHTYSRNDGELFFQDEVKLGAHASLMAGARYDTASEIHDYNNVAPRVSFAFTPDRLQKTVFRVGAGLFYLRPSDQLQERVLLNDGVNTRQITITDPSYPDPFAAGQYLTAKPEVVRLDPNLTTPFQFQTTFGVERQLGRGTLLTAEYTHMRGYQLLRANNANPPVPGTGVRLDPNFANIVLVHSTGTLNGNGLTLTLDSRITNRLKLSGTYTFSKSIDDADSSFALPPDSSNLAAERGPANYDMRHKFVMAGLVFLPRGFQVGVVANLHTGVPYTILTGNDDNGDGVANDRPAGVGRNSAYDPGFASLDLRFSKVFLVGRPGWAGGTAPSRMELNLDAFNVLNTANLGPPVNVITSPLFGQSNTALAPRTIQLSMRYFF